MRQIRNGPNTAAGELARSNSERGPLERNGGQTIQVKQRLTHPLGIGDNRAFLDHMATWAPAEVRLRTRWICVTYRDYEGDHLGSGCTVDLSQGGIRFQTDTPPPVG